MPTGASEIGASGLVTATGGIVQEELHPNLTGRRALDTWRTMKDNDALVGAILYAIEMLVRQVEWRVERQDAKEEHAEFLEGCLDDMSHSWSDLMTEILSMLPFGWSFCEIVYKQRQGPQPEGSKVPSSRFNDNKIGWRKIALRAQETLDHWEFDEDGGIKGFVQRAAPKYEEVTIPMVKGLLFRTTSYKNNPEGRSILRNAYVSWYYKKRVQTIEGTGIERDLAGFPVIWLPSEYLVDNADPEKQKVVNAFMELGKNIRRDKQEFMLMPLAYDENGNKAFDFTLMNSGGSRVFDTNQIISRYNQEIAMTVLGDFILLGHEKVGSFALSSDKTDLFAVALGAILDNIQDVLNRYAVPRLFALNGFPVDNLPEIVHGDIENPDLSALGSYISTLAGMGMTLFPDDDLEDFLRKVGGLPEKSEEAKRAQEAAKEEQDGGSDESGTGGSGGTGEPVTEGSAEDAELAGL